MQLKKTSRKSYVDGTAGLKLSMERVIYSLSSLVYCKGS